VHFGLSEEQVLLQQTLRQLAAKELPPPRRREIFDAGDGWDEQLWRQLAEVGLTGLVVPPELGGSGLELLDLALAFEVLGEAAMPGPLLGHALATLALVQGGSDVQRERWLPGLASGEIVATVALGEPGERWDEESWSLPWRPEGLHGEKRYVETIAETRLIVVGLAGGELALVEREAAGLELTPVDGIDRGRPLAHLRLDGTPGERLERGPAIAGRIVDAARILLAADAFGAAWKLIRTTVEYALSREQFGTPIAQFQAVKHQLADMAVEAEPLRGLVWHAAYAFDQLPDRCPADAAAAKAHVTDAALRIGREAVALHGGIGFTWECDVQIWVKRTMHDRVWLGSPESHGERVARLGGW
jgi:alkylation response protein AidB-like acyl-CoA dehydrogenase